MNRRQSRDLDRYITGNYGEDQFDDIICMDCDNKTLPEDISDEGRCSLCQRAWNEKMIELGGGRE